MAVITGATPAWPSHRNARLGPFEYDGKLYVVMPDYDSVFGTNRRIYVFESLDGGATWAHYVDTHQEESSDWASADAQLVGSVLYIAAARSGGGLALGKVDLATGVARKNFHDGHTAPVGADNPHVTGTFPIFIAVRSSSEVLVFHQGPMETVNSIQWRRHVYSKWESGVWVATNQPLYTTLVQEHHDLRAVILGIDGQRVHVFWSSPATTGRGTAASRRTTRSPSTTPRLMAGSSWTSWPTTSWACRRCMGLRSWRPMWRGLTHRSTVSRS